MIFASLDFLVFLLLVLFLYRLLPFRGQNLMLLAASLLFYGWWDWRYLGLLLLSALTDATASARIGATEDPGRRRAWLLVSLCVNLGVLGLFKYLDFFVRSAGDLLGLFGLHPSLPLLHLVLPVGLSFFTFQSMAYTIDVYRRRTEVVSTFDHLRFVAFFPVLLAGPIERHEHLLEQLRRPRRVTAEHVYRGVILILWGLFKKVVVADNLAPYVDAVYGNLAAHSGASVALATYLFAFQIYCDFSGYSDMAVGIARLMGVELVFNFQAPYLARDIQEFWRRWHVSLSTWLRDYVFLPLGGAFQPGAREVRNILLLFLACGLWHGASWTYVTWGALHGIYLLIWRLRGKRPPRRGIARWLAIVVTFHQVLFAWLFFRAGTLANAGEALRALGRPGPVFRDPLLANALFPLLLLAVIEIAKDPLQLDEWLLRRRTWVTLALGLLVVFLIVMFGAQAGLSFIYFKY